MLFPDILVPIPGTERGWQALQQALVIARRRNRNTRMASTWYGRNGRPDCRPVLSLPDAAPRRASLASWSWRLAR